MKVEVIGPPWQTVEGEGEESKGRRGEGLDIHPLLRSFWEYGIGMESFTLPVGVVGGGRMAREGGGGGEGHGQGVGGERLGGAQQQQEAPRCEPGLHPSLILLFFTFNIIA